MNMNQQNHIEDGQNPKKSLESNKTHWLKNNDKNTLTHLEKTDQGLSPKKYLCQ